MILVTGATGNIGRALLKELHARGAGPLRGLTRDPARAVFPDGVEAVEAVLDVTGGDVNDELLMVRDTVAQITGTPARPFRQWASENANPFR
ncbi:NAD(P)H-binding protein [Streptomyces sp. MB09-01]|uniref:NAD(P)H-binding protein n=1 Tax=Streptomyces sp. MB09-01 TaxID=3028666 RepID=UPI0029ACE83C|nr:NAD(P)H-binding protein [Streptomyces sp. MB09-01]MDX3535486.1 NAD(P)H-binding protein [Streptomyces sp. MB09-01]